MTVAGFSAIFLRFRREFAGCDHDGARTKEGSSGKCTDSCDANYWCRRVIAVELDYSSSRNGSTGGDSCFLLAFAKTFVRQNYPSNHRDDRDSGDDAASRVQFNIDLWVAEKPRERNCRGGCAFNQLGYLYFWPLSILCRADQAAPRQVQAMVRKGFGPQTVILRLGCSSNYRES